MKITNISRQDKRNSPKSRILISALSVFAGKGKAGARMQNIADNADVNKATVYYYYNSKDNLYRLILKSAFQGFIKTIHEKLVQDPQNITIDKFNSLLNDVFESQQYESKLIIRDLIEGGDNLKEIIRQQIRDETRYYQNLKKISSLIEIILPDPNLDTSKSQMFITIKLILKNITNRLIDNVIKKDSV